MSLAYATALSRNPEATYRQIELAGQTAEADGPALVQLLYDQAIRALRGAASSRPSRSAGAAAMRPPWRAAAWA